MRILFFALLGINAAALILQLTVWKPETSAGSAPVAMPASREGGTLALLAERGDAPVSAPERPAVLTTHQEGGEAEALCVVVGPFPTLLRAEYFVEALAALEVGAEVRELEVPEGEGYWLYLPPEPSKKLALERLREVQAQDIDSYLIPRGELANGISLGMFTREALALEQQAAVAELGYDADIKVITRTRSEIWVRVDRPQSQRLSRATWHQLLEREKGVEKLQKYCQGVASE